MRVIALINDTGVVQRILKHLGLWAPLSIPPARMSWARLLERVFAIDVEHCPQCGGDLKIISAIEEPAVIVRARTVPLPGRRSRSARTRAKRSNCVEVRRSRTMWGSNNHREKEIFTEPHAIDRLPGRQYSCG